MDELIKILLMHGYPPHPKDSYGQTPLLWAAKRGNEAALRLLLEQERVEKDSTDGSGRTALSWAAGNGHDDVVRLLLEEGSDINAKDNDGWAALQHAIWNTESATVRLLLEHKANIMAKDNNGWTALHRAADSGREDMLRLLIGNESIDAENMTPEMETMIRYKTFVKKLVKEGVVGTLHHAIKRGDETTMKLLVEKGANTEMRGKWKRTALHEAADSGNEAIMQILLENGADVEARDTWGWTPIHRAARALKMVRRDW
jgi:ankyrin repeat domain-containing protein 50